MVLSLSGYKDDLPPDFVRLVAAKILGFDFDDERLECPFYLNLAMGYRAAISETKAHLANRGMELSGFD